MATLKGVNATKSAKSIPDLQLQGEDGGRIKSAYDIYTLAADASVSDIILVSKLPEGARVIDVRMVFGAMGGSATFDIGWAASADAVESASGTGFGSAVAVSSAGVYSMFTSSSTSAGFQKIFAAEVQVQINVSAVTSGATGKSVSVEILYVVD